MKQLLIILAVFMSLLGFGQSARIELDTNRLRIGEQTVLHILFEYQNPNGDALIIWPENEGSLTKDIEIVDKTIDRDQLLDSASSTFIREQQLLITIFDEGRYTIPSQDILLGDSIYSTNTASILIETVEVDTSKGIHDIKPIYTVEYPFTERTADFIKDNWIAFAIIIALIISFILFYYFKKRKEDIVEEEEIEIIK